MFMCLSFSVKASYLEMLQTWLFPRLQKDEPEELHYAAGWGSPAFSSRRSSQVERRSSASMDPVGCSWGLDVLSVAWRSPDLTSCNYFLWVYVKDKVFVPPQHLSIPDLKNRITAAVETITPDLLSTVWQELDYRLDVCRVTKGAYIEHL